MGSEASPEDAEDDTCLLFISSTYSLDGRATVHKLNDPARKAVFIVQSNYIPAIYPMIIKVNTK